ncbi:MAG: bifunctional folylpolyglutamate synthase/dihydrofolate synthase, partial [Hyphomicrobiales bacterium]|nr:bifunctional folylpolyglutamate synthase/dihydrofolate synthase [Hyphomicrobiales bacterium]
AASTAGRPPKEVIQFAREAGLKADEAASIEAALERIAARVWEIPPRILLAGSLYFSGEVLEANGTPPQ